MDPRRRWRFVEMKPPPGIRTNRFDLTPPGTLLSSAWIFPWAGGRSSGPGSSLESPSGAAQEASSRRRPTVRWASTRQIWRRCYVSARALAGVALFDHRYGVTTHGVVHLADLATSEPRSMDYMPAGVWSLRRILGRREVSDEDVFIDFGSGKGRVVLQAALHYPFRTVCGIELSEHLHRIAEDNVSRVRHRLGDRRCAWCGRMSLTSSSRTT
jgi:hypothetical protein